MRYRIEFAKTDLMRYTGHLDLHRAWERLARRAGIPLAYTQGFSPHPRINLASALPLGFTSQAEIVDIWLDGELDPQVVQAALQTAAPPGIEIKQVMVIDVHSPTLQTVLEASLYLIRLLEPIAELEQRVSDLLAAKQLPRTRRGKPYDLRALVLELEVLGENEKHEAQLRACLMAKEGATGRPEELLEAMGIDSLNCRVERVALLFKPEQAEGEDFQA